MKYIKFIIAVFMLAISMVVTSCGSNKNQDIDTNQEVGKATQTE